MNKISDETLAEMAALLSPEERDEMAIPSYLHRNPLMRWMAWSRVIVLARWIEEWGERARSTGKPGVIVDHGCGCGVLLETASRVGARAYGIDIVLRAARHFIEKRGLDNVTLLEPDRAIESIPADSVDLIVSGEVLEHVPDLDETAAFFRSVLRPDGRLLVSLPTEGLLYRIGRRLAGFDGHYHHLNAQSIHQRLVASGFQPTRVKKLPLPGVLSIYWCVEYVAGNNH